MTTTETASESATSSASSASSAPHKVKTEKSPKRVRAYLGGTPVADSLAVRLVWEVPYSPTYYFPEQDVRLDLLKSDDATEEQPKGVSAQRYTVAVDGREAPGAALRYRDSAPEQLRGLVRLDWDAMDNWFEEDEEVFVHPRDPHHRVDVLASGRRVQVEIDGVEVADSTSARMLFETGLPTRYYLPKTDVRLDLFRTSQTTSHCPYKGDAHYYSVQVGDRLHEDVVWGYQLPQPESQKIAGLVSFYNEKVDIIVDGVRHERPTTMFS